MEEKLRKKQLRRNLAPMSRSLLLYYILMNVLVMAVVFWDAFLKFTITNTYDTLSDAIAAVFETNYWGYLLAIGIGLIILLAWKGTAFWKSEIWKPNREMEPKRLIFLVTWLFGAQLLFTAFNAVLDWVLGFWGLTTANAVEMATSVSDSPSMFFYACIAAPISEELLFRGLILRGLMPYGKKFAVFTSALLFGLYHGNLVQSPFAFLVGLIFAYTAAEYNIAWAMVLHVWNNMILGDTLDRLLAILHPLAADILDYILVSVLSIGWIVLTIIHRKKLLAWLRQGRMNWEALWQLFRCPSTIVLTVICIASMVMSIL